MWGGNSLEGIGSDETTLMVTEGLKAIRAKNSELETILMGILPRPAKSDEWDEMRRAANSKIEIEIQRMRQDGFKVSYLNLDYALMDYLMFRKDGIHLNDRGVQAMGSGMLSFLNKQFAGGAKQVPPPPYRR